MPLNNGGYMRLEVWKDINKYKGIYQVSNLGRVKSLSRYRTFGKSKNKILTEEKILKQYLSGNKNRKTPNLYYRVKLTNNGVSKTFTVHRLVAESFLENPNNFKYVNHKDENKTNNYSENLEWCTLKYNNNYGTSTIRRVENTDYKEKVKNTDYSLIAKKLKKAKSKSFIQYTLDGEYVKRWEFATDLIKYGFSKGCVNECCNYKRKTHKGYVWRFEGDING